jgi:hypothetical protein
MHLQVTNHPSASMPSAMPIAIYQHGLHLYDFFAFCMILHAKAIAMFLQKAWHICNA